MKNVVFGFVIVILLAVALGFNTTPASADFKVWQQTDHQQKCHKVDFNAAIHNGKPWYWTETSCLTNIAPTNTPVPTATNTQEPTSTPTDVPTATPTDVPPTATLTDIPTDEPTSTPTEVVQPTATPTTEVIEATATPTEQESEPTATGTPVFVVTSTPHPENQCWRAYLHHDLKYILRHMESGVIRCFAGPKFPVERNENGSIVSHHH